MALTDDIHLTSDKETFIKILWNSLYVMAFLDIKRASKGGSKIGAFILSSCFIEYLAGFRYGKKTGKKDYINFVKSYFNGKYNPEKLYTDLRCKLVHNYSEGGTYAFTDSHPELHNTKQDGRTIVNLENFIADIEEVLNRYFDELRTDDELCKLAKKRFILYNLLTFIPRKL